ncbi:DNA-binding protein WhiA [Breznakia sp. PF5-3]|uniref:DNA-binding protein WhiA n=1 Tax=unclassified Breznakia TaxID=2623764 RepID=UPI002405B063|nr:MULTISPECIES: DNA-binding protein WhiA [unclassified Breznakia]MDF9825218.1 DNA-binding protein WhiA [Breznakia sp. PM6-1]MDF9836099.1 DNA-binding protein WhiA [Breznakia sp. PF5-3]MDF9838739.1 DNA-binding protein WhiA [Breznakia sp. PFB2-8]MDF9860773.1 DNA-binding protein WhiA [Breznakia sp. PH5-24]
MSFTSDVKKEICMNELSECCKKAQLSAFLQISASLNFTNEGMHITCQSENVSTAKHIYQIVKELYQVEIQLSIIKKMKLKKNNIYVIKIKNKAMDILKDLEIIGEHGLNDHPSSRIVKKDCCIRAYLSGAFLASGSVNSPVKSNYHLEIACSNKNLAKYIMKQMNKFYLMAKHIKRRNQEVVYIKASDKISDFLKCVGASSALFSFEDTRIQRDFMNSLTRLDNCELANEMKTLKAAQKQLEDIDRIDNFVGLESLPKNLYEVAIVRKENPEANLNELCVAYEARYNEQISKSGIRHRLNKIRDLALQYKHEV